MRIISGRWRRRLLPVPACEALRPTADRIRETLFNWLAPIIEGASCLDAFAGSGALGFEAASRGAAHVTMLERDPALAEHLCEQARVLGAVEVEVVKADALRWLSSRGEGFDVAFLDPPFGHDLLARACALLERGGWLRDGALIYLEQRVRDARPELPPGWSLRHEKTAGQVRYYLAARHVKAEAI